MLIGDNWKERQYISLVMDYTNAGCRDFGGGTHMVAELEYGPGSIFTPRLSIKELEEWCEANIGRFEKFFDENEAALDRGEVIKLKPCW